MSSSQDNYWVRLRAGGAAEPDAWSAPTSVMAVCVKRAAPRRSCLAKAPQRPGAIQRKLQPGDERGGSPRTDSLHVKLLRTLSLGLSLCLATAHAAQAETALTAMKLLPDGAAQKVLRIEAQNGRPYPQSWRLTVKDPKAQFGLREYVVRGGEIVTEAESTPPPRPMNIHAVIGTSVKVDSDEVTALALDYALANSVVVSSMNHELQKRTTKRPAEWKVTCFTEDGAEAGSLVLSSTKGTVLSQAGFSLKPRKNSNPPEPKFKPLSKEIVGTGDSADITASLSESQTSVAEPIAEKLDDAEEDSESAGAPSNSGDVPKKAVSSSSKKHGAAGKSSRRTNRPSAVSGIHRATAPVRRVIRRVLPF